MATVEIRGLDEFMRGLSEFEQTQLPFAISKSLNDVAFHALRITKTEMTRVFDRPTTYTLNALKVIESTKESLVSAVVLKDAQGFLPSLDTALSKHYLVPQVHGGKRVFKKFEAALFRQGVLPPNYYTVPASGATMDSYGNMSRGQIIQIMAYFDAFQEAGFSSNMFFEGRERLARGTRRTSGISYFVVKPGMGGGLKPGIYMKTYFSLGQAIKPVLLFVRNVTYRKRLDLQEIANQTYNDNFNFEFNRNFNVAVNTAWPR